VQGIVQGVGFRPFVYRLATELGLTGFVGNDGLGVILEVEGDSAQLDSFVERLSADVPPLAQINTINTTNISPAYDLVFTIVESRPDQHRNTLISPDIATCDDCLEELLDPADRRFRYPFINCTNCGPRFTIILDTPYDRDKTTMRVFPMCPDCEAEYRDPLNRRFHAQPNACPICGPRLRLINWSSQYTSEDQSDLITATAKLLAGGAIVAIKGLGGFHFACDAQNAETVARLRRSKRREAKPLGVMVPDLDTARQLCFVSDAEAELLQSRRRPIVLLRQRPDCAIAPEVAPCYNTLGLMLPYMPLHTLLLRDFADQQGSNRPTALVMTSGNISDEPIVYQDADIGERLAPIADNILTHNREIHTRTDDSVVRITAGKEQILRRSRGYVPEPIKLLEPVPTHILAVGGHLKNTFCLCKDDAAFLSHHIGDLENLETLTAFREGIEHFEQLFDIHPEVVAYDLHPDYLSTSYALELDVPLTIGVQHHHAHIASVLAEHGLTEPVIGVAADGTGYGTDGTVWGGEVLVANLRQFERAAHLSLVPLPGGEQAIRQPWRMAAVYLQAAFGDDFLDLDIPFVHKLDRRRWQALAQMIEWNINSPQTSSLGRLFDAVASLLGVRNGVVYEGQAAVECEMLALLSDEVYPFVVTDDSPMQLDVCDTIRAIVKEIQRGKSTPVIAGRFHRTIAEMLLTTCEGVRRRTGLEAVALSGGVFQNQTLLEQLLRLLQGAGFRTYINQKVPPNDGGLSLGQAAIAAAQIQGE
jgi:hydrogenase maturation protein HypF